MNSENRDLIEDTMRMNNSVRKVYPVPKWDQPNFVSMFEHLVICRQVSQAVLAVARAPTLAVALASHCIPLPCIRFPCCSCAESHCRSPSRAQHSIIKIDLALGIVEQ